MRFESYLWAVLALFLAGVTVWEDGPTLQPSQADVQFEAKDGGNKIPPE